MRELKVFGKYTCVEFYRSGENGKNTKIDIH